MPPQSWRIAAAEFGDSVAAGNLQCGGGSPVRDEMLSQLYSLR